MMGDRNILIPSSQSPAVNSDRRHCARLMRKHRASLVNALIAGVDSPRENRFDESPEVFAHRLSDELELLIRHIQGHADAGALYAGQRLFELYKPEHERAENYRDIRKSVEDDRKILQACMSPLLSAGELAALDAAYLAATAGIVSEASRHVRTLFVGDCMMPEIMAFLVGPLMAEGISIDPFPVNSRNPAQLRKILDSLAHQEYDAIFVSPFSHARVPELEALLNPARNLLPQAEIEANVRAVLDQTKSLLDYLSERFECPIFVHNAALVQRADNIVKVVTRALLTRRACMYAKRRINQWVADYVVERNAATFRHLVILDEDALAQKIGRHNSGRCLHSSEFQHATVLSQHLAHEYHARLCVIARLLGRKLVVCDLDNTLWDGVIGEGAVEHFADRQRTLKRLQTHGGIVLSIASKNDPRNVHFTGGHLTADDFVAPQISWKHKAGAVDLIKAQLNLQTRHMVFLDDRADERALVMESHPDILALDPGDPEVWKRLELWADLVHGSSDLDRTRLYREQAARDASFKPAAECTLTDGAFLQKLGLTISIRAADKSDLKRTAELINRTNQWNLCGSRTTFEQILTWHASDTTQVLVASAADRFGEMGTVCVAVMTLGAQEAEIPIFVLSCRVFGYGVETAMLREIARRSDISGARTKLIGHYRPTDQNYPARTMYADHGFKADSGRFVWVGEPALPTVAWADIRLS